MSQTKIPTRAERDVALRQIVLDVLELSDEELTDTGNFVNDYGADSLQAIEIVAQIERDLGVFIPQDVLPEMVNMEGVYAVVDRYAGADVGHE